MKKDVKKQASTPPLPPDVKKRQATALELSNILCEYLDAFMIVGYDLSGVPIKICVSETQKDKDALSNLMANLIQDKLNEE